MRKPLASPIFAKPAKKRICPLLIQVGSCERVRDDGLYFYSHSLPHDPIRLEVYQDSVHFFQMFADIDKFAVHGLKRLGHFVREFSGQVTKPDLTRSASFIYNSPNFPFAPIPDVEGIIHDGVEELLKNGIWKINEHGDIIVAEIMQIDRNSFQ